MKKIPGFLLLITLVAACSKGGGSNPAPTPPETPIVFDVDAAAANTAIGSTFGFTVRLVSAMPSSQGIKVEVSANEEGTGTAISPQNPTITSTSTSVAATVIGLPVQKWVIATVKVSSVATASNSATKTFRVVQK